MQGTESEITLEPQDAAMRLRFHALAQNPPQTLLIEGGAEARRLQMALYWAMTAKCPEAIANREHQGAPCLQCATCRQVAANAHTDIQIFDGRISNKQDEEAPGPVKALRMENVRELKASVGSAPRGPGPRVVLLQGMQLTREEALNCLLKTLEEPAPDTLFVLLAPQREQLLPTLVSRSMCVTLPWTSTASAGGQLEAEMAVFLRTGEGTFLEHIAAKGALDAEVASLLLLGCRKAMSRSHRPASAQSGPLERALEPLGSSAQNWALAALWLSEAQEMLQGTVAPAHVMQALCSRLFILLRSA